MNPTFALYSDPNHPHYSQFLPIIDAEWNIQRIENRVKTHQDLLLHPVVRGIILTPDGRIIMQKKKLKSLPIEVLDTTISWHISGTLEEMMWSVGKNVSELLIPQLRSESREETGINLTPDELIDLGKTWLYPDLPDKTEIAYVMMSQIRRKMEELTGEEWITFEAIGIEELLKADRTWRVAWDIIGPQWAHVWDQVQKHI